MSVGLEVLWIINVCCFCGSEWCCKTQQYLGCVWCIWGSMRRSGLTHNSLFLPSMKRPVHLPKLKGSAVKWEKQQQARELIPLGNQTQRDREPFEGFTKAAVPHGHHQMFSICCSRGNFNILRQSCTAMWSYIFWYEPGLQIELCADILRKCVSGFCVSLSAVASLWLLAIPGNGILN